MIPWLAKRNVKGWRLCVLDFFFKQLWAGSISTEGPGDLNAWIPSIRSKLCGSINRESSCSIRAGISIQGLLWFSLFLWWSWGQPASKIKLVWPCTSTLRTTLSWPRGRSVLAPAGSKRILAARPSSPSTASPPPGVPDCPLARGLTLLLSRIVVTKGLFGNSGLHSKMCFLHLQHSTLLI